MTVEYRPSDLCAIVARLLPLTATVCKVHVNNSLDWSGIASSQTKTRSRLVLGLYRGYIGIMGGKMETST